MITDYVPSQDAEKLTWALNLQNQSSVPANATAMGWDAADLAAVQLAAQAVIDAIMEKGAAKQVFKSVVSAGDLKVKNALGTLRQQVGSGKNQATYTEAVGDALGVVATGTPFDPAAYVAVLRKVEQTGPGQVEVVFAKAGGEIDGVKVQMRRGPAMTWTELAFDTTSPYVDTTPLAVPGVPETREYRVRGVIDDVEIGTPSGAVTIAVM